MPQHRSAKKRIKTSMKRRMRNRAVKGSLKSTLKKYRSLQASEREKAFASLQSALDKAARKGIIHPNKAARLKSRLTPTG